MNKIAIVAASAFLMLMQLQTSVAGQELSQQELDQQLQGWSDAGLVDYDFVLTRSCFCQLEWIRPGLVQVRDGEVAAASDPMTGLPLNPDIYLTIDDLFGVLQKAIDDSAEFISVSFDESLAYPDSLYVDTLAILADEEIGYSAEGVTSELTEIGCSFDDPLPCAAEFIDQLNRAVRSENPPAHFDLTFDGKVSIEDMFKLIEVDLNTYFGDSNLDGEFNSSDMVHVMQAAEYEDSLNANSTWTTGDWNGDQEFDSTDWVLAMSRGNYEKGPRAAAIRTVPEPQPALSAFLATAVFWLARRRK